MTTPNLIFTVAAIMLLLVVSLFGVGRLLRRRRNEQTTLPSDDRLLHEMFCFLFYEKLTEDNLSELAAIYPEQFDLVMRKMREWFSTLIPSEEASSTVTFSIVLSYSAAAYNMSHEHALKRKEMIQKLV